MLLDRDDNVYVFRVIGKKVYYLKVSTTYISSLVIIHNIVYFILFFDNIKETLAVRANCVARENMASAGVCFGKFTHNGKFRLQITCLDYLAQYAKVCILLINIYYLFLLFVEFKVLTYFQQYKVWIKKSAENSFVYGNHVLKSGLGRITDNTPVYVNFTNYYFLPTLFPPQYQFSSFSLLLNP